MSKRIISMVLALVMVLGMLPVLQAEAAGSDLENCYVDSWDELLSALIKTGRVYIELTDDIEASSEIGYMFTIRRDYVLLNLNGKSLKFKCTVNKDTDTLRECNSYTLFQIPSSCQMTIQDTSAKKTGSIWYSAHINGWRSFVCSSIRELFDVYGKLTVEGGKLISGDVENQWVTALSYSGGLYTGNVEQVVYGTPVRVRDGGEVTINGGSLSGFGGPKTYRFVRGERMDDYAGAAIALEPGAKVTITGGNFFGLCGAFPVTFEGNVNMTVRGGLYWPAGIDAMLYNVNGKVLGNVVGGAVVLPDDAWKDAADRLDIYKDGVKWTDDQEQNAFIHAFSKIMIEPSQDIPEEGKISATVKEGSSVIFNEEERLDMKLSLTAMTEGSLSYSFDSFYKDAVKGTFYKWKLWRGKNASGEADAVVESTKLDLAAYAGLLSTSPVWTVQCEAVEQVGYYSPKKQTVAYSEPLTIRIPELLKFKDQSPAMQAGSTSCTITRELGTFTYSFDNVAVTTQAAKEGLYIAKNYALYAPDGEIISSRTTSDQGPVSDTVELTELGYYMLVENLRYMNQDGDVLETLTNKIYIKTEKQAEPPEVISQPGDMAGVEKDSSVELSAKATGADKAQWYVQRKDGSLIALDTTFDGTTAKATAVASAANVGAKYYCLFTGEKGLTDQTGDITVCYAPVLTDGANVSGYTGNTAFLKLGSADGCGHYGDQTGWYGPDGTKLTDGRYIPMGTTLGIQNLTLSDSGTYTYKYHTAHGELAEAAVTLTVYRGMAPGSTISTFDVYGLDLPVLGENLDTEVNVPSNANYTVQSLTWTGLGSTVCNGTSGSCKIVLKANAGYTFKSGDMAGTVNSIPKTVYSVAENASEITITVDFNNYSSFKVQVPAQDPVELTTERLVFKLNEAASGQKLEATWSCDHGETLKHSGVKFWVSEGTLPAGLTLNADGTVTGTPTEDGVFAVNVTVSTVDAAGNSTNCCGFHTATVAFVVETDHTHTFTKTGTTATCISYGKDTFTCECGATYEAFAEAYGHNFGRWVAHSSSTCTEEGSKIRLCTNEGCDAVEEIKLAALGHSESDWCTSDTQHWTECIRCGLVIKAKESHTFNENRKCTVCGITNPSNEITSIVTYITPPYAGRYSHSTGDVPADVPYEVDKVEWTDVTDASKPVNLTEGTDVFVKGHTYLAIVYVQALEGYEFSLNESGSTDLTGKLNGEFATVEDVYSKDPASYVCMTYTFGPLKTAISSVNATVEWPTAGNIPNYEATIRGIVDYEIYEDFGATYAKNGIRWYDETTDIYLQPGVDAFVDGHVYTVEVAVKAKDGAVFVTDGYGNPMVTTYIGLNSEPAEAIPNFDSETYILARYCFRPEPTEGTPVLFTADSEAKAGKTVTVDIEAMAEADDSLMDAYFNNDVAYQWYCDGTAISGATGQSLSFTDSDVGKTFHVVVTYDNYESVSETFTVEAAGSTSASVYRISGKTRIQTSMAIADALKEQLGVTRFDSVIVASSANFPDALTGSYLAAVKNAPILLTSASAHADVVSYITLNMDFDGTVYILGGTGAVSQDFEDRLIELDITYKRLSGKNRYLTNLKILEEAGVNSTQEILISTGTGFADSLSASAAGLPILLVGKSLTAEQKEFLATTSGRFVIIGGTGAVSAGVEGELNQIGSVAVERLSGKTRYQTSVLVAERFVPNPDAVILAYAQNYPDGLCGGPLAVSMNASLILTDNYKPESADDYVAGIAKGVVVGGASLIGDETVVAIFDMAEGTVIPKK